MYQGTESQTIFPAVQQQKQGKYQTNPIPNHFGL